MTTEETTQVQETTTTEPQKKESIFSKAGRFVKSHWKGALAVAGAFAGGAIVGIFASGGDDDGEYELPSGDDSITVEDTADVEDVPFEV